jgi:hypothetical protein
MRRLKINPVILLILTYQLTWHQFHMDGLLFWSIFNSRRAQWPSRFESQPDLVRTVVLGAQWMTTGHTVQYCPNDIHSIDFRHA